MKFKEIVEAGKAHFADMKVHYPFHTIRRKQNMELTNQDEDGYIVVEEEPQQEIGEYLELDWYPVFDTEPLDFQSPFE